MRLPTHEELERADRLIKERGLMAPVTIELGLLAIKDPTLRAFIDRLIEGSEKLAPGGNVLLMRGILQGALIGGLNFALTVEELRGAR